MQQILGKQLSMPSIYIHINCTDTPKHVMLYFSLYLQIVEVPHQFTLVDWFHTHLQWELQGPNISNGNRGGVKARVLDDG